MINFDFQIGLEALCVLLEGLLLLSLLEKTDVEFGVGVDQVHLLAELGVV